MRLPISFELDRYTDLPTIYQADDYRAPGVKSLFFQNEDHFDKETRVFGWIGMPYLRDGDSCPAMVLIHGGRGTAFDEWVRLWNATGYAAITVDLCGCVPRIPLPETGVKYQRHEFAGPEGWDASFEQMEWKTEDQWQYHAATALLRAHTIIANTEGVDPDRIGVTGISWGGYLTCLMMGIDPRYKVAIPVYGCSRTTDGTCRELRYQDERRQEEVAAWGKRWDAIHYIPNGRMPSLWVSGTNEDPYTFDCFANSFASTVDPTVSIRVEMPHGHTHGWAPSEIHHFTDALFKGGAPLPRHVETRVRDGRIISKFESARPLMKATLCYTRATGLWPDRKWNQIDWRPPQPSSTSPTTEICSYRQRISNLAALDEVGQGYVASAELPLETTAAFINVTDDRDLLVSSTHIEP